MDKTINTPNKALEAWKRKQGTEAYVPIGPHPDPHTFPSFVPVSGHYPYQSHYDPTFGASQWHSHRPFDHHQNSSGGLGFYPPMNVQYSQGAAFFSTDGSQDPDFPPNPSVGTSHVQSPTMSTSSTMGASNEIKGTPSLGAASVTEDFPALGESRGLEDRLRGMILNNAKQSIDKRPEPEVAAETISLGMLPPHLQAASHETQEEYLQKMRSAAAAKKHSQDQSTGNESTRGTSNPRKRMNQAQRRQLSAQNIIPVLANEPKQQERHSYSQASPHRGNHGPRHSQHNSVEGTFDHQSHGWRNRGQRGDVQPQRHNPQRGVSASRGPNDYWPRAQIQQPRLFNPNSSGPTSYGVMDPRQHQQYEFLPEVIFSQGSFLQRLAEVEVNAVEISPVELASKEALRACLEQICREAIYIFETEQDPLCGVSRESVSLRCFGSLSSGFATKSSDMDLAILSPKSNPPASSRDSPIPRLLEDKLLDLGYGARLLTKTRVAIIKLCEKPSAELLQALRDERARWVASTIREGAADAQEKRAEEAAFKGTPKPTEPLKNKDHGVASDLESLKQGEEEPLMRYYWRMNNHLQRLDGENTSVNQGQSSESSNVILQTKACRAFLHGLSDAKLKERLLSCPSLNFDLAVQDQMVSLRSVFIRAEGEILAIAFEDRATVEPESHKEEQIEAAINEWRALQSRTHMSAHAYQHILQRSCNHLRSFPSIKLETFRQRNDENAEVYKDRALALLRDFGVRDFKPELSPPLFPNELHIVDVIVTKFTDGIHHKESRTNVQDFLSRQAYKSLAIATAQLLAEQRVLDYQKAVARGQYEDAANDTIKSYVAAIRQYGALSSVEEVYQAEERLKLLPDPRPPKPPKARFDARLEFPKEGVGIQCDINFSNMLALQNTQLLRCYSHCDSRVRPMVLFVKSWAKQREINSSYRGTLSSYGYVLMVLHFLMNIAEPPLLPNLQQAWRPEHQTETEVDGYDVRFWRNEEQIKDFASKGQLMPQQNSSSLGELLRGFFDYYARQGPHVPGHGFSWGADVISIRTPGGLLSKQAKGWTGAKTTITESQGGEGRREVRHRYLMAIEDPFEIDHNVARTVIHQGIVAIRDEFRRAWRIIVAAGQGEMDEELLAKLGERQTR